MYVGAAFRNQRQLKRHKIHLDAVMTEMMAKSSMEGIQFSQKVEETVISQMVLQSKKLNLSSNQQKTKDFSKQSIEAEPLKKEKSTQNTRISLKLEEIVKYAEMFPSKKARNSKQMRETKSFIKLAQSKKIPNSRFKNRREAIKPKINQQLFLNFDIQRKGDQSQEKCTHRRKKEKQKEIEQKIKIIINKNKENRKKVNNFTMRNFIQAQMGHLKKIKRIQRNTHQVVTEQRQSNERMNLSFYKKGQNQTELDIRNQNIRKVQQFIKGGEELSYSEFSDHVTLTEVEQNRKYFPLYERIYKKIKNENARDKMNIQQLRQQSLKNTIYLAEAVKQQTKMQRKTEIRRAMKKLKILP